MHANARAVGHDHFLPHISQTLTPWSRVLLEKLIVLQLVKTFPTIMEIEEAFRVELRI
jgi:hypothetical protein